MKYLILAIITMLLSCKKSSQGEPQAVTPKEVISKQKAQNQSILNKVELKIEKKLLTNKNSDGSSQLLKALATIPGVVGVSIGNENKNAGDDFTIKEGTETEKTINILSSHSSKIGVAEVIFTNSGEVQFTAKIKTVANTEKAMLKTRTAFEQDLLKKEDPSLEEVLDASGTNGGSDKFSDYKSTDGTTNKHTFLFFSGKQDNNSSNDLGRVKQIVVEITATIGMGTDSVSKIFIITINGPNTSTT